MDHCCLKSTVPLPQQLHFQYHTSYFCLFLKLLQHHFILYQKLLQLNQMLLCQQYHSRYIYSQHVPLFALDSIPHSLQSRIMILS